MYANMHISMQKHKVNMIQLTLILILLYLQWLQIIMETVTHLTLIHTVLPRTGNECIVAHCWVNLRLPPHTYPCTHTVQSQDTSKYEVNPQEAQNLDRQIVTALYSASFSPISKSAFNSRKCWSCLCHSKLTSSLSAFSLMLNGIF